MLKIRKGIFETNSSSTHAICFGNCEHGFYLSEEEKRLGIILFETEEVNNQGSRSGEYFLSPREKANFIITHF